MFTNTLTFFEKDSNEPLYTTTITDKLYYTAHNIRKAVTEALENNDFRKTIQVESILTENDQPLEFNMYKLMFSIEWIHDPSTNTRKINWKNSQYKLIRMHHENLTNETIDRSKPIYTIGDLMDDFHTHAIELLNEDGRAYERLTNDDYYQLAQSYLTYHSNSEPIETQIEELILSYASQNHII